MIEFEGKVKLVLTEKKESIGSLLSLEGKQNFTIKVYTLKKNIEKKNYCQKTQSIYFEKIHLKKEECMG